MFLVQIRRHGIGHPDDVIDIFKAMVNESLWATVASARRGMHEVFICGMLT